MQPAGSPHSGRLVVALLAALITFALLTATLSAAGGGLGSPAGKVYVTAVHGPALIRVGDRLQPLVPKQTYHAKGLAIETGPGATVSLVFSNGMSVTLEANTKIEVKRFTQDPFRPDHTNMTVEPSISQAQLAVAYGTAVISVSSPAAGSSLTVSTPFSVLNVHSGTLVVTASDTVTNAAIVTGDCTVSGGDRGSAFRLVQAGETAVVHPTSVTQPDSNVVIEVAKTSTSQTAVLDGQASAAVAAKSSVYFQVKESTAPSGGGSTPAGSSAAKTGGAASAPVTAFDAEATGTSTSGRSTQEVVAVPVVPLELPTKFTVSPANLGGG